MKYLLTLSLVVLTAAAPLTPQGVIRHDRADEQYLELAQQPQFDAVVLIRDDTRLLGSAVLIAPSWLITARHVVETSPARLRVEVGGQTYRADRLVRHLDADRALVRLASPVESMRPARRYRGDSELGSRGVSVGFGISGRGDETIGDITIRGAQTIGSKRAGENMIDDIKQENILRADFDHPNDSLYNMMGAPEALDLEYFPFSGDSGGGLFMLDGAQWVLAGVTISGATPPRDLRGDGIPANALAYGWISQWHRVSAFNAWIDAHLDEAAP